MKELLNLIVVMFLCFGFVAFAQLTPEQKKQMEEAQKKAAEAQKKVEEMMKNNPQMKQMMEQMKKQDELHKAERKKKQAEDEKRRAVQNKKHLEDFYWRGKIATNTNGKFANWQHGVANIAIYDGDGKMDQKGDYLDKKYVIVGTISTNGQVSMNFPQSISTPRSISKSLVPEMHSVGNNEFTFSNPNTLYRWPGFLLTIIKDYKKIGDLYIGNSERTTYNLAAPCCLHYGDEGYRLYWVYVTDACTAKLKKEFKQNKVYEGEAEKIIDQSITYDLNFKPGWNLIKTEIKGNYMVGGRTRFKNKTHTVVSSMPTDAKYYFRVKNWNRK